MTTQYYQEMAVKIMHEHSLVNGASLYLAAKTIGLSLAAGCALIEKESNGHNSYGHDLGGALSGYPRAVDESGYHILRWLIDVEKKLPNGIGPAQITSVEHLDKMVSQQLRPWVPVDNMTYGFGLLKAFHDVAVKSAEKYPWAVAGSRYNGGPNWRDVPAAVDYGKDLSKKISAWLGWLAPAAM